MAAQPSGLQNTGIEEVRQFTFGNGEITPTYYEGGQDGQAGLKEIENYLLSPQGDLIAREGCSVIGAYYDPDFSTVQKDFHLFTGVDNILNTADPQAGFGKEVPIAVVQVSSTQQKIVNLANGLETAAFDRITPIGGPEIVSFRVTHWEKVDTVTYARIGLAIVGEISQASMATLTENKRLLGVYVVIKDGVPTVYQYIQRDYNDYYTASTEIVEFSTKPMTAPVCGMEFMRRAAIVPSNDRTSIMFSANVVSDELFIPLPKRSAVISHTDCRLATLSNHILSGLEAIDGITPVANDRVLVWKQSDQRNNGVYLAQTGAWTKAADVWAYGDYLKVTSGATYTGIEFTCMSKVFGATQNLVFENLSILEPRRIKENIESKQPHELFGCPVTDPYKVAVTGFYEAMVSGEQIRWITSHKGILIGTDRRVGYVAGTEDYIRPGGNLYLFKPLADVPCATNGVIKVQDVIFFLRADRNALHRLVWVEENQTYEARPVTDKAETKVHKIKKMVKIEQPFPVLFMLGETIDGENTVACAHVRNGSVALTHLNFGAEVVDIATYSNDGRSFLVFTTRATASGDTNVGLLVNKMEIKGAYDVEASPVRLDFSVPAEADPLPGSSDRVVRTLQGGFTLTNYKYAVTSTANIGFIMFMAQKYLTSYQGGVSSGMTTGVDEILAPGRTMRVTLSGTAIIQGREVVDSVWIGKMFECFIETAPMWAYIGLNRRILNTNVLVARGSSMFYDVNGRRYYVNGIWQSSFGLLREMAWNAKAATIEKNDLNGTVKIGLDTALPQVIAGMSVSVQMAKPI